MRQRFIGGFAVASVLAVGLFWWLPNILIDCDIFWWTIECLLAGK